MSQSTFVSQAAPGRFSGSHADIVTVSVGEGTTLLRDVIVDRYKVFEMADEDLVEEELVGDELLVGKVLVDVVKRDELEFVDKLEKAVSELLVVSTEGEVVVSEMLRGGNHNVPGVKVGLGRRSVLPFVVVVRLFLSCITHWQKS